MMAALRELLLDFGVKWPTRELKKGDRLVKETTKDVEDLDKKSKGLSSALLGVGAAIATAFSGDFVRQQIQSVAQLASETRRLAATVNTTTEDFLGWQNAMAGFGVEADDVQDILKEMQIKAQEALADADPSTGFGESFARIGITLDELRPRVHNASELLQFFVEEIENVDDVAVRSLAIDELFSDAGTRAIPFFNQGAAAIQRLRDSSERQGQSTIRLAHKMATVNRVLIRAKLAWTDLWATLTLKYLPKFLEIMEVAERFIGDIKNLTTKTDILKRTFTLLGIVAAGAAVAAMISWIAAAGPITLAIIGVSALYLLFEDLKAAIEGDSSALKEFLDTSLGLEDSKATIQFLRNAWKSIGDAISFAVDGYRTLVNLGAGLLGVEGPVMRGGTLETAGVAGRAFRGGRGVRRFVGRARDVLGFGDVAEPGASPEITRRMIVDERLRRESHRRGAENQEMARTLSLIAPEIESANIEFEHGTEEMSVDRRSYEFQEATGERRRIFEGIGLPRTQTINAQSSNVFNITSTESEEAADAVAARFAEIQERQTRALQDATPEIQ
jgi:hypothetical protein